MLLAFFNFSLILTLLRCFNVQLTFEQFQQQYQIFLYNDGCFSWIQQNELENVNERGYNMLT